MGEKYFSVIIPCYNAVSYLDCCIESLLQQTFPIDRLELILIDDASTDATKEKIQFYEKKYPHIIKAIYFTENKRQGGARNAGLSIATGTYIVFLDSDDWADLNMYQILYDTLQETKAEIVQYSHYDVYPQENVYVNAAVIEGVLEIQDLEMRKLFLIAQVLTCGSQTKAYRKEFLDRIGVKFPEHLIYEEPYFVYPQLFYVTKIVSLKQPLYYCRIHQNSTMRHIAKEKNRLQEHAIVQRLLYENMKEKTDIFALYKEEIEYYFLTTFYVEMLLFSGKQQREIELSFFEDMQTYVKQSCKDWQSNSYFQKSENSVFKQIINTVYKRYTTETLKELCLQTQEQLKEIGVG